MPPTVILIRHAEAMHNQYYIPDPDLSPLGIEQCKRLNEHLRREQPLARKIERVICSPMIRTVRTAMLSLDGILAERVPFELDAGWQETSNAPCDTPSPVSDLSAIFPHIDFSALEHPPYPAKTGPFAFTPEAVHVRGQTVLRSLFHRPENVIAVVSHSAFLRIGVSGARFANADYRIFDVVRESAGEGCGGETEVFAEEQGAGRYAWYEERAGKEKYGVREWDETAQKGGGMGLSEKGKFGVFPDDFRLVNYAPQTDGSDGSPL